MFDPSTFGEAKNMLGTPLQHIQEQCLASLALYPVSSQHKKLLIRVLHEPGKLFSQDDPLHPAGVWSQLTYLLAQQVASHPISVPLVSSIAVAVECTMSALDLLDDIEDGDITPLIQELGVPLVLNAACMLDAFAKQVLLSVQHFEGNASFVTDLLKIHAHALLTAATGQHIDLAAETRGHLVNSSKDCLSVVKMKSGSLVRMVCLLGARSVGADEGVCKGAADFGENEGLAQQLKNDSHDLYALLHATEVTFQKSDLERKKKTLPIVRAMQRGYNPFAMPTEASLLRNEYIAIIDEEIETTWQLSRYYHTRAYYHLLTLTQYRPLDEALLRLLRFEEIR